MVKEEIKDGDHVWMNQNQLAELFDTSKQSISYHIVSILRDNELDKNSVVKNYLTTALDGKQYKGKPTYSYGYETVGANGSMLLVSISGVVVE